MTERAPAGEDRPTLAADAERCAGFTDAATLERCTRRFSCARFLAASGPATPFRVAACEGGDAFLPVHAPHDATPRDSGASLAPATRPGDGCATSSAARGLAA